MKFQVAKTLLLGAMCLFLTGCGATRFTQQQRSASFRELEGLKVGPLAIRDYLGNGSGILFDGVQFSQSNSSESTSVPEQGTFDAGEKWSVGTATAVDQHGYFVTAAHCVEGEQISLIFSTSQGTRVSDVRVVWMGDLSKGGMDFALLHVPSHLERVFPWATEFRSGDTVISVGVNFDRSEGGENDVDLKFQIEPVGGRVSKIIGEQGGGVDYRVILHDSPVVDGFSGGPLIDKEGRLLAIHSTGQTRFPIRWNKRMRFPNAVRPDVGWLTGLIERDQAEWNQMEQ